MPTITVPASVTITVNEDTGETILFTFADHFMNRTILRDQQFGVSSEWLYAACEIRGLIKGAMGGDIITLTEDQYSKLVQVVKRPSQPYNPQIMIECRAFVDAVLKAS